MPLYIRSNVSSLDAQRSLSESTRDLSLNYQRLSSGYRINSAADDAAGLSISEGLMAQMRAYTVVSRNASDAISMAETADGAASQMSGLLARLRELAVQSSNGALQQPVDRTNLNTEFTAVKAEIDRISNVSTFNGTPLLSGAPASVQFQVGINMTPDDVIAITFGGITATSLGVAPLAVDTQTGAEAAITAIDQSIDSLSKSREDFGASINRLQTSVQNLQTAHLNTSAANSRIRDVDVAQETAEMARSQVLTQAGSAVLAQTNKMPELALSLLRN